MTEDFRKVTEKEVQTEIKVLKNVFSTVRLLSAGDVGVKTANCKKRSDGNCYDVWKRKSMCRNCISYRALTEKQQFSKIEKIDDGIYQVIADYREVDGKPCVIEMIRKMEKDIAVDFGNEDRNAETLNEYFEKTYTDVLTETYNRRYYEEYISNQTMTGGVAMVDLDDFKIYNDLFGHDVGDKVINLVAAAIKSCVRYSDKVVRYGGDEFLIIISGVKKVAFERVIKDIKETVKKIEVEGYPAIKPSVSVGYKLCYEDVVKTAVSQADEFMYLAKKKKNSAIDYDVNGGVLRNRLQKKELVLIVDDSALNREILSSILKNEYEIIEAEEGMQAIEQIGKYGSDISVVLLDLIMPGMSGFDVLDQMESLGVLSEIPVIAITGDESSNSMRIAYEKGVSDYIIRPFDAKIVYRRVSNTIKVYSKQKRLISEITGEVQNREKNRSMLVEFLSQVVEQPDGDCDGNHAEHMMKFTRFILEKLIQKGYCYEYIDDIYAISTAAALHDIGKAQIDRKILNKKGKLTAEEFEIIKTHTVLGEKMLKNVKAYEKEPIVKYAKEICRHHHERYDGNGYPDGLKGDEIPYSAQAVSICDVYDALISKRPYKPAYTHEEAVRMIKNGMCGQFNPLILDCFEECADKFKEIADKKNKEKNYDE